MNIILNIIDYSTGRDFCRCDHDIIMYVIIQFIVAQSSLKKVVQF